MNRVLIVGGGTAGLLAGISVRRLCPGMDVTVVRSVAMGHIMVGEGTFAATPRHLHEVLGIARQEFLAAVHPTLKLGIRFLWGPRPYFDYPFNQRYDNEIFPAGDKPWGYYGLGLWDATSPVLEAADLTRLPRSIGYHVENGPLVAFLERHFEAQGGVLRDAKVIGAETGGRGIARVVLDSGEKLEADHFIDASGFGGTLIHSALGEPYRDMSHHLFCDRAVVGGWERPPGDHIRPYTTAETMDAGWCWQIEHRNLINRGYVFSSTFLDDDAAEAEYRRRNPQIGERDLRVVPFKARRLRRAWVGNVAAVGNACGFVEPLEATNIQVICDHTLRIAQTLALPSGPNDTAIAEHNARVEHQWVVIRDFLALHYRFNRRLDTPFWRMAQRDTPLGDLEPYIADYRARGPALVPTEQLGMFGYDGYLALLLGMRVPWERCPP